MLFQTPSHKKNHITLPCSAPLSAADILDFIRDKFITDREASDENTKIGLDFKQKIKEMKHKIHVCHLFVVLLSSA